MPIVKYCSLSLHKTLCTRTPSFRWKAGDEDALPHWNLLLHRTWQIQAPAIHKGGTSVPLIPSAWKFCMSVKAGDKANEILFLDAELQASCRLCYVSKALDSSPSTTLLLLVSFHLLTHAAPVSIDTPEKHVGGLCFLISPLWEHFNSQLEFQ